MEDGSDKGGGGDDIHLTAEERIELRQYAWSYFAFHADQRLRTFNFFLALVAVMVAGVVAIVTNSESPILAVPLAGALVFTALIFWLLDERNHDLLDGSEIALKSIEASMVHLRESDAPGPLQLFSREKFETDQRKSKARVHYFTYHSSFRVVFGVVFIAAVALIAGLSIAELR